MDNVRVVNSARDVEECCNGLGWGVRRGESDVSGKPRAGSCGSVRRRAQVVEKCREVCGWGLAPISTLVICLDSVEKVVRVSRDHAGAEGV